MIRNWPRFGESTRVSAAILKAVFLDLSNIRKKSRQKFEQKGSVSFTVPLIGKNENDKRDFIAHLSCGDDL